MPEVGFSGVASVSSEDKVHKAVGLLKSDGLHKWQCAEPGEQQAVVVLQLRSLVKINKVHIGNEHSAFIEVLVAREPVNSDSDYVVLVSASAFMSPTESKTHSQPNRVRMFDATTLCAQAAAQKWDRLKIVCTQPFNRQTQYGVSFVRVFTDEAIADSAPPQAASVAQAPRTDSVSSSSQIGSFKLRAEDESRAESDAVGDSLKPGQLFYASRQRRDEPSKEKAGGESSPKRARPSMDTEADTSVNPPPIRRNSSVKAKEKGKEKNDSANSSNSNADPQPRASRNQPQVSTTSPSTSQKPATRQRDGAAKKPVPFNMLMKKVVFVLSGFQNPLRSDLRDQALEMGAQYKPDWTNGCTHLICAFQNTPKYKQVAGKGRIVKQDWIVDCHKQKQLLDWRKYRLGRAPSPPDSDQEESDDAGRRPTASADLLNGLPSLPKPIFASSCFLIDTVSLTNRAEADRFLHDARRIVVAYGGSLADAGNVDYVVLPDAAYQSDSGKKDAAKRHGRSTKLVCLAWLKRCAQTSKVLPDSSSPAESESE